MEHLLIGKDIPEGLHLTLTEDGFPVIRDAQDVAWIKFTNGGNGDPESWQRTIIENTCKALEIDTGVWSNGDLVTIQRFIEDYQRVYVR